MFCMNKSYLFLLAWIFTSQIFLSYTMEEQIKDDFLIGFKRGEMENLLSNQSYKSLQTDLYAKFYRNQIGMFQWICGHTKFGRDSTIYDPLLLYFCLRGCYYKALAPKTLLYSRHPSVGLINSEVWLAYRSFLMLAVIIFADAYAATILGYGDIAGLTYNFLIDKFRRIWLPEIIKYNFGYEESFGVIKSILTQATSEKGKFIINEKFLDGQLRSAAWISCSSWSWNSFYFGEPDETRRYLFESRKEDVKNSRRAAITKILDVFSKLRAPEMAGKIMEFASRDFATLFSDDQK